MPVLSLLTSIPIQLLVVVAVINGIAVAPFLLLVMLIARDRSIIGEYRNGRTANALGWSPFAPMAAGALALLARSMHP
ncbi:MAG TPA: hypothetical protein VII33_17325 [Nakamurella sp.]